MFGLLPPYHRRLRGAVQSYDSVAYVAFLTIFCGYAYAVSLALEALQRYQQVAEQHGTVIGCADPTLHQCSVSGQY